MVCTSANNTDSDSIALVPSGIAIDNIDSVPGIQVINGTLAIDPPDLKRHDHVISLTSLLLKKTLGVSEIMRGSLTSGCIGLFTGPHQISFSDVGSLTMRLSRGERPVFSPEYAVKAPDAVIAEPVS